MYKIIKPVLAAFFVLLVSAVSAQQTLREQIAELAKPAKGIVGVSVLGLEDRDTVNYNGNSRMVLESVMKFPVAMTVLHFVDSGVMTLDKEVHFGKKDVPKTAVSPLRDKYPKGGSATIRELLTDMVSYSDNNACDILLDFLSDDGTGDVMSYLHSIKVRGINVEVNYQQMDKAWQVQYTNWCKPVDMVKLLDIFYNGKALSPASKEFLYQVMTGTTTGPNRIKGLLPAGTVVAHKTGSSGTNDVGLSPATNDVGIITLPNGKHVAIAIFVCNSGADEATRDMVIAKIAKAVYDHEIKK
jgi:beta-lactamase class A